MQCNMDLDQLRQAQRVAYVFSGGSSRCAFQVGVVERLHALGITPSMTFGVSAGAWNAAIVAARAEHRIRFYWRSFLRMPHIDLRNLLFEHSPWRYAEMHRRNFGRFIGARLHQPEALPCLIQVTRLRDRQGVMFDLRNAGRPIDVLLAANYLPPFFTHAPRLDDERYGDGGITDNAPYERAFAEGADAVVLVAMKGEAEGGLFKNANDVDHVIPAAYRSRMVVIRPRYRLPVSFRERNWDKLSHLMDVGDLRTREVLLGERHAETELRASGDAPSVRLARLIARFRSPAPPSEPLPGPAGE
jgi:predicted acylesterase/phospholipase RssA